MKANLSLILFFFLISACNGQTESQFSLLTAEVSKKSIDVEYLNSVQGNISISYPHINNESFSQLLQNLMTKDKEQNYCDNKGKVLISYEVKHMTLNLLSVLKKVDIQFCPHYSDIHNEEVINYLLRDGELIPFRLSTTSESELKGALKNEEECIYYPDKVSLDFYVGQGKSYLQVWQSKICNYTIELPLTEDTISFE